MINVTKPRIIKNPKTIEQVIIEAYDDKVKVISKSNKEYFVSLSDKLRFNKNIEIGDTAIIKTFPNNWVVTDIKKPFKKEEVLTEIEEQLELERQQKELEDIGWGVY